MGNPHEHTPVDHEGLPIEDRLVYENGHAQKAATPMPPATPMPASIAKALIMACRTCKPAAKTGRGTDARTGEEFSYSTVDDVLEAGNAALNEAGVIPLPMCTGYREVSHEINMMVSIYAEYDYKFMLVHEDGSTWVNPYDTKPVSIKLEGGKTELMAQSFALKAYLKGLLRIITGDVDVESLPPEAPSAQLRGVGQPQAAGEPPRRRGRPPKVRPPEGSLNEPKYPFDFGRGVDPESSLEEMTASDCLSLFMQKVGHLPRARRLEWREANRVGLEQLFATAKPIWKQICEVIEGA